MRRRQHTLAQARIMGVIIFDEGVISQSEGNGHDRFAQCDR